MVAISKQLCDRIAGILGGTGTTNGKTCSIMIERKLNARILGKPYETEHEIAIQSLDSRGRTLNTGEITLLQTDVQRLLMLCETRGCAS
jgi:hypothetical protein